MSNEATEAFARPRRPHADKRPASIGPTELDWAPGWANRTISGVGDFLDFALRAVALIPHALRSYPSEVFRYAGVLIRGSSLVVLFMLFNLGLEAGLLADTQFRPLGITSLNGAAVSVAIFRGCVQVLLGWVIAAKIGCGLVTEIGAMRINEEVDALEVMGMNPISYLVSTRIMAVVIVSPGLIIMGYWMSFWGPWLVDVPFLGSTSDGAFWNYLFALQNLTDFIIVTIWAVSSIALPTLIGAYFGYTAKGGPVGVGENTAKSMLISMATVSVIATIIIQLAYGVDANSPIGN
ncbi:ABC transporter permease [Actinomycetospora endophytica]|uniref:ABC transporter permease n=1 Tax=Actinomycetospora endophytica TaxID=2291215 RepID=A0ABS8PJ00_9PSEU|nr:ABC transporter permease [Actinomycetospora endophytica]MCD2198248.1 ABC transporter permease [Actinomycetospora endophytica]